MAKTLAEIRARLQQQDSRKTGEKSFSGDNTTFPHWNIAENTTARVRFLPDADTNNPFFWVEKAMINLEFKGIKGEAEQKSVFVQVPCMEMWNEACPILAEVRAWFKDPALEELGRKYWKKRSYLFQGFVRETTLQEEKTPENPIRRFTISPQIFSLVKNALLDPEMDNLPTDYDAGLDFNIKKTTKGNYADYNTSSWARRESSLTHEELEAIEKYGLHNLADSLPKKPDAATLAIIKEMFEASVDGQPYDVERWGQYYRPRGVSAPAGSGSTNFKENTVPVSRPAPVQAPVAQPQRQEVAESVDDDDVPFDIDDGAPSAPVQAPAAQSSSKRAEDILAIIRSRQTK